MNVQKATFAAGCFWGVQHILDRIPGVIRTRVGYTGGFNEGDTQNVTYEQVCTGKTGHAEAVEIEFDSERVSYAELLDYFWRLHDPTQVDRQGVDVGTQYRSAIFYHTPEQRAEAEASKTRFDASGVFKKKAATVIVAAGPFFEAETYHQKYFDRNNGAVCHVLRDR